jgi:lysophospholipase L1-like esterase
MTRRFEIAVWTALAAAAACLCGCASLGLNGNTPYLALGDFITDGATLANPVQQAYPTLVGRRQNAPFQNLANSGDQACDVPARQIFPNGVSPTLATHPVYSVLIGTNDVDNEGAGAYEPVFMQCHQASLGWLALPTEYKILAGQAGFVADGPGAIDATNGWNAWQTAGQGSSVSFTITLAAPGAIYAWPLIDDASDATYTYTLDGVVTGTATAATIPKMATGNGTTRSLGFIRWPAVTAGQHTVTFTQISAGSAGVAVVGVGSPTAEISSASGSGASASGGSGSPPAASDTLPTVLAGTVPRQLHTGANVGCQATDAPCEAYNTDILTDVALFAGDGLNVKVFDTRGYLQGTAEEMSDATHPNAKGQQALSEAVRVAWAAKY